MLTVFKIRDDKDTKSIFIFIIYNNLCIYLSNLCVGNIDRSSALVAHMELNLPSRTKAVKDSIKDLSKLTLFFILIFDGGGGYLSGEDGHGGRGGAEAAADRDVGGGLTVSDVAGDGGGVHVGSSDNEKMFLEYKELSFIIVVTDKFVSFPFKSIFLGDGGGDGGG